jgi:hypothetical protein
MSRNVPIPYFPVPPMDYQQGYMAELVRAISLYTQQVQNPGEGRNTFTVFTNLQSENNAGLEVGTVFEVDGMLHVVKSNKPYVAGLSASGVLGAVTVSTT